MKERPILFNTAMVQAILAGRKNQTRRVAQVGYEKGMNGPVVRGKTAVSSIHFRPGLDDCSPFGERGDRLWVREAFQVGLCTESTMAYRASHKPEDLEEGWFEPIKWRPSIHMPRWACRIVLEITGLRVERLQDISEADALAEGITQYESGWTNGLMGPFSSPVLAFSDLWDSTGGDWIANPWVWVIEFKVLTDNGVVPEVAA
jgi:hypothetical protein